MATENLVLALKSCQIATWHEKVQVVRGKVFFIVQVTFILYQLIIEWLSSILKYSGYETFSIKGCDQEYFLKLKLKSLSKEIFGVVIISFFI